MIKNKLLQNELGASLGESLKSVLPIFAIVLVLSISLVPMNPGILVMFLFGTIMLIVGMSLFTIGSSISMEPIGEGIGSQLSKSRKLVLPVVICFVLGIIITIAEPDLQVLAEQVPSIPNIVLILCVALGVGAFLSLAMIRAKKNIALNKLLLIFYGLVAVLSIFVSENFIPTAFDSGGVTTGPITVPFIMALGVGMASLNSKKGSQENSFGLVSLCSIGPILSVLILSICFQPKPETSQTVIPLVETSADAFRAFLGEFPKYIEEVPVAFLPILAMLVIFQLIFHRFRKQQLMKISIGFVYTFAGLVLFLTGANVGFMPAGRFIGEQIAASDARLVLIPIGMVMGYFVVSAEPAVHSLKKQVEEVTNGAISQRAIGLALSLGVAVSVGIAMLRVLTGIPIYPFLIAGYIAALTITFFVPRIYTGIAFDSGGVASGPMTTTFMLPFAIGACEAVGGNIMTDAFGIVAMVATTPLIAIQVLGLHSKIRQKQLHKRTKQELLLVDDDMIFYEEV